VKRIHKVGLALATGAIAVGGLAGIGTLAQAADPTTTPSATPAGTGGDAEGRGRHGGGRLGAELAARLAEKLGLDEAAVAEALDAAREATRPAEGTQDAAARPDRAEREAALAAALASGLGIDEARVTEALDAIRADAQAARKEAFSDRLAQAVTDGTLTQAEADAVQKAADAGVIPNGGGRR